MANPTNRYYDYAQQAWIVDGVYITCGHLDPACGCYGKAHAGERAPTAQVGGGTAAEIQRADVAAGRTGIPAFMR